MTKKKTQEKVKCPDCGASYVKGAAHIMFCPSHTCDRCGTTFSTVIEPNKEGERICPTCELDDSD